MAVAEAPNLVRKVLALPWFLLLLFGLLLMAVLLLKLFFGFEYLHLSQLAPGILLLSHGFTHFSVVLAWHAAESLEKVDVLLEIYGVFAAVFVFLE